MFGFQTNGDFRLSCLKSGLVQFSDIHCTKDSIVKFCKYKFIHYSEIVVLVIMTLCFDFFRFVNNCFSIMFFKIQVLVTLIGPSFRRPRCRTGSWRRRRASAWWMELLSHLNNQVTTSLLIDAKFLELRSSHNVGRTNQI